MEIVGKNIKVGVGFVYADNAIVYYKGMGGGELLL